MLILLMPEKFQLKKLSRTGPSLVAQWLRICLPMEGTRAQALVWEDPTCCGATKPVHHNYWARAPQLLKPARLQPMLHNKRATAMRSPRFSFSLWASWLSCQPVSFYLGIFPWFKYQTVTAWEDVGELSPTQRRNLTFFFFCFYWGVAPTRCN